MCGCAGKQPILKQRARATELDRQGAEFFYQGQYKKALTYFQKALRAYESIDHRQARELKESSKE
ncbi:MAG: tetratricopeptide repeat protein [Proteobacteria bacterium]|nr:tetratricopeptide repeat protein [Pseudomonadota bacterium]